MTQRPAPDDSPEGTAFPKPPRSCQDQRKKKARAAAQRAHMPQGARPQQSDKGSMAAVSPQSKQKLSSIWCALVARVGMLAEPSQMDMICHAFPRTRGPTDWAVGECLLFHTKTDSSRERIDVLKILMPSLLYSKNVVVAARKSTIV